MQWLQGYESTDYGTDSAYRILKIFSREKKKREILLQGFEG